MSTASIMRPLAPIAPAPAQRPIAPAPLRQSTKPVQLIPAPPRRSQPKVAPVPAATSSLSPVSSADSNNPPTPTAAELSLTSSSGGAGVKPSKDWVLPARAKPGRKPSQAEPPTKRKAQNRASQRAFRERKQSYLSSLEDRVAAYEAGEVSKNVELQKVARSVKVENDTLRKENDALRLRIAQLESQIASRRGGQNEGRTGLAVPNLGSEASEVGCKAPAHELAARLRPVMPSAGSSVQPGRISSGPSVPLPRSKLVHRSSSSAGSSTSSMPPPSSIIVPLTSPTASYAYSNAPPPTLRRRTSSRTLSTLLPPDYAADTIVRDRSCGFCTQSSPCVCLGEAVLRIDGYDEGEKVKEQEACGTGPASHSIIATDATRISVDSLLTTDSERGGSSVYTTRTARRKLWPTVIAPTTAEVDSTAISVSRQPTLPDGPSNSSSPPAAICSGDPRTCGACNTDPGLQAFCEAVSRNVAGSQREPAMLDAGNALPIRKRHRSIKTPLAAPTHEVGDKRRLWHVVPLAEPMEDVPPFVPAGPVAPLPRRGPYPALTPPSASSFNNATSRYLPGSNSLRPPPRDRDRATIPDAWRTLKSHPRFPQWDGGLALLADVVSRKSKGSPGVSGSSGSSYRSSKSVDTRDTSKALIGVTSIDRPGTETAASAEAKEIEKVDAVLPVAIGDGSKSARPANASKVDHDMLSDRESGDESESGDELDQDDDDADAAETSPSASQDAPPSKRRRIYVERDALRDALRLLDGAGAGAEACTSGTAAGIDGDACPCPWKPRA